MAMTPAFSCASHIGFSEQTGADPAAIWRQALGSEGPYSIYGFSDANVSQSLRLPPSSPRLNQRTR
jgi:hypothetical protein